MNALVMLFGAMIFGLGAWGMAQPVALLALALGGAVVFAGS